MHGEMVAPTPEACARWCERVGASTYDINPSAWRSQAVMACARGLSRNDGKHLEPILRSIALGRCDKVEKQFFSWAERWARHDRLVMIPEQSDDDAMLLRALCTGGTAGIDARVRHGDGSGTEEKHELGISRVVVRCGEVVCIDQTDECMLSGLSGL